MVTGTKKKIIIIIIIIGPCQRTRKAVKHEDNHDTNCNWSTWNGPQRLGKGTGIVGSWSSNQDHPDCNIVEIGQNTEKSPGDLIRLAVTHPPVKDHQLTLKWKTCKEYNNNYAQKEYKSIYDWVGKVIHWELCKRLKFDYADKWYMHKPKSFLENGTHKFLWDFHIPVRRSDLVLRRRKKTSQL